VTTLAYKPTVSGDPNSGLLDSITDPEGRITRFTYYPTGRVKEQELPDDRVVAYQYDGNGNVTSITPPGRPPHTSDYTALNFEMPAGCLRGRPA